MDDPLGAGILLVLQATIRLAALSTILLSAVVLSNVLRLYIAMTNAHSPLAARLFSLAYLLALSGLVFAAQCVWTRRPPLVWWVRELSWLFFWLNNMYIIVIVGHLAL